MSSSMFTDSRPECSLPVEEDRQRCVDLALAWIVEGFERQQRALRADPVVAHCSTPEEWDSQVDVAVEQLRRRFGHHGSVGHNPTLNGVAEAIRQVATNLHNGGLRPDRRCVVRLEARVRAIARTEVTPRPESGIHSHGSFVAVDAVDRSFDGMLLPLGAFPSAPAEGSEWDLVLDTWGVPWSPNPGIWLVAAPPPKIED